MSGEVDTLATVDNYELNSAMRKDSSFENGTKDEDEDAHVRVSIEVEVERSLGNELIGKHCD